MALDLQSVFNELSSAKDDLLLVITAVAGMYGVTVLVRILMKHDPIPDDEFWTPDDWGD